MSKRIFRMFNPKEPPGDPVEKRRAQVRRAQQTYRERKDKYTRALEGELVRSRQNEANLLSEVQNLRDKVQLLNELLSRYGTPVPSNLSIEEFESAHRRSGSTGHMRDVSKLNKRHEKSNSIATPRHLHAGTSGSPRMFSLLESRDDSHVWRDGGGSFATPFSHSSVTSPSTTTASPSDGSLFSILDPTIMAMDFVLTLERPCLGHFAGDPQKPEQANGHALTLTAQLHVCHPDLLIGPKTAIALTQQTTPGPQPAALLSRLLTLAPDVCTEGEITPIQAWNYIQQQPNFARFETHELRALAEKLRESIKCHGFGAVINPAVLQSTTYEVLMLGRAY